MSTVQDEIRTRIEAFTADLTALVRQAALDSVRAALGETPSAAPTPAAKAAAAPAAAVAAKRGRGRPRKVVAAAPAATPVKTAAAPVKRGPGRPRKVAAVVPAAAPVKPAAAAKPSAPTPAPKKAGAKRDPGDLAKLVERLAAYIKANPGKRIEQINKPLNVPTKDLALPIKKLLAAKRITTLGQKRATTYSPA